MSHGPYFVHNVYRDGLWVTEIERAPQGWRAVSRRSNLQGGSLENGHRRRRPASGGTHSRRAA